MFLRWLVTAMFTLFFQFVVARYPVLLRNLQIFHHFRCSIWYFAAKRLSELGGGGFAFIKHDQVCISDIIGRETFHARVNLEN